MPACTLRSCLTLCNPRDCNPPGSPVREILHCHAFLQGIDPGIKPMFPALSGRFFTPSSTWEAQYQTSEAALECVLAAQLCPTLCNPRDYSLRGSSVHGILQGSVLEWVVIPFSRGSSWPRDQTWSPVLQVNSLPSQPPRKISHQSRLKLVNIILRISHLSTLSPHVTKDICMYN